MRIASFQTPSFGEVSIGTIESERELLCAVQFGPSYLVRKRFPHLEVESGSAGSIIMGKVWCALERGDLYEDTVALIGTDFQREVWNTLRTIPYATTVTYADVANYIGNPKAVRAVGKAVGANPLAVIVPCHRVVGKNNPDAYHWGGELKRKLLDKEYLATHPTEIVLA